MPDGEVVSVMMDQGRYDGEMNANGERHGRGKCQWFDGSTYDGSGRMTRDMALGLLLV